MGEHAHIGLTLAITIPILLLLASGGLSYWIVQPFKPHLSEFNPRAKSGRQNCCHRH